MGVLIPRRSHTIVEHRVLNFILLSILLSASFNLTAAFSGIPARTSGRLTNLGETRKESRKRVSSVAKGHIKMSCSVLVVARGMDGRAPMLAHSFDTAGGTDFRLVKVPAMKHEANSMRPVFCYDENSLPRFAGTLRGAIPEYTALQEAASVPIGFIPQVPETFAYWEAASGICNEQGVMLAECTCSSIFAAEPKPKGKALLGYMELTRLALERASTAREAVTLMGELAEQHGFYGNSLRLSGAAESLAVAGTISEDLIHLAQACSYY